VLIISDTQVELINYFVRNQQHVIPTDKMYDCCKNVHAL